MYDHSSAVYNHNCLKVPINPKNDRPKTQFEQKFLVDLHNEVTKNMNEKMKTNLGDSNRSDVKAFIDFFDSIPEYDDINHLSNQEFYNKLENLKEKQREFCEYWDRQLQYETKDTGWIDQYKILQSHPRTKSAGRKKKNPSESTKSLDEDNFYSSDKPPSRRSVRIEESPTSETTFRPKSRAKYLSSDWNELNLGSAGHTPLPLETKSAPNSPVKVRKDTEYDGITVPKPFQMTVRDEENKIVEELYLQMNKPKEEKPQQFKAHDVPIESQIPLFEKIMEDQHKRSLQVKEQRKATLQAQMKPFSFTKRDEEIQELTRKFSKSLPCVYNDEEPVKIKKFKAKPVPKNLFSNYIYKKMHEDEFYRALQKKVRAEEMLKHASLPPSMAYREKTKPKIDVCPRSYRDETTTAKPSRKTKKVPNYKLYHDKYEKELEELKNEFISTSPRPFKLKSSKKKGRKNSYRISSATSKCSSDTRTPSSLDLSSINRSNLAAVLRIQSARRRLEMEMTRKIEEAKLKEEARWKEKVMRKKPVWQALAYSHEEDLAMRLQLRRDEEKLRNEEHKLRMELMLGRVNQQPTLFERQSQVKFPKTREELVEELHKEYKAFADMKSMREMKDEAVQVLPEDSNRSSEESFSRRNSKESEDKEQCQCLLEEFKV